MKCWWTSPSRTWPFLFSLLLLSLSLVASPAAMEQGIYSVGLAMPDSSPSLGNDVRYSIRFASLNVWN